MISFITKIFGDPSEKKLKIYKKDLEEVKKIEKKFRDEITTIEQVQAKTHEFQSKFTDLDIDNENDIKEIKKILNSIKNEAIALHRRACEIIYWKEFVFGDEKIIWNMIPYDVQILGAMALHDGNIAEMRTWEGKTLVATIAAYLNALVGYPVHVVTVNDYLARRDAKEMSIIYGTLGLSTGVITHSQGFEDKKIAYSANIVYATNNELGFDYLRDNMAISEKNRVMKKKWFAIVDEVDSILIDEARTPLIISAPAAEATSQYTRFAAIAKTLKNNTEYKIDEKQKTAILTEEWIQKLEEILGIDNIYVSQHYNTIHHIENALKASAVYKKDIDYLIRNDEILIIDEHTGRVLPGRRYSDGLHQAIEAKEGVTVQQESRTLASVTFQNYFRLYKKLSWMTGTAKTEEEEFYKIYSLEVITIPTNKPIARVDRGDLLFSSTKWKYEYIVKLIQKLHEKWQPVLVWTVSVEKSEYLSDLLNQKNIPHQVLNAKQDSREAEIVADAGKYGAVTIATNMAGRGTDIKIDDQVRNLSWEVSIEWKNWIQTYKLGGLFVIWTEKHETRRIDNQLRGRSGRQWDPWLSQFMLAPEDDIVRVFGWERYFSLIANMNTWEESDPLLESRLLTRNIASIQKQVEWRNFDIRKHILEYDDVLNQHRLAIYSRRNRILEWKDIHSDVLGMLTNQIENIISIAYDGKWEIEYDIAEKISTEVNNFAWNNLTKATDYIESENIEDVINKTKTILSWQIESLRDTWSEEIFSEFERRLTLSAIDELWMNHIDQMAHLREEVAFEWYAQKNPLVVYKERAYESFIRMMSDIEYRVIKWLLTAKPVESTDSVNMENKLREDYIESAEEVKENNWIKVIRVSDKK